MGKGGIMAFLSFGVSGCNVTKSSQRQSSNNVILSDNHCNAQNLYPLGKTGKGEATLPVLYDNISQKRDDSSRRHGFDNFSMWSNPSHNIANTYELPIFTCNFSHMYLLPTFIAPKISSAGADSRNLS